MNKLKQFIVHQSDKFVIFKDLIGTVIHKSDSNKYTNIEYIVAFNSSQTIDYEPGTATRSANKPIQR